MSVPASPLAVVADSAAFFRRRGFEDSVLSGSPFAWLAFVRDSIRSTREKKIKKNCDFRISPDH